MDFFMKYILIIALWFVVLSNVLFAKSYVIQYEIYDDSSESMIFEVKEELFEQFDYMVDRVDAIYVHELLKEHMFYIEGTNIEYHNFMVTVVIGDGLGSYIHGELVEENCVMKPRGESFIKQMLE
jgi:hypothetical protein